MLIVLTALPGVFVLCRYFTVARLLRIHMLDRFRGTVAPVKRYVDRNSAMNGYRVI